MIRGSSVAERQHCKLEAAGSTPAPGTILSGHQPVYLPGIILFDKIAKSDAFMWVGHCQYSPKSWQSRNVIRGGLMLSVPVKKDMGQSIDATEIDGDHWKKKHLKSLSHTYAKRPFFHHYFGLIGEVIGEPHKTLGQLNRALVELMLPWFGIGLKPINPEGVSGHKTDMLISMCGVAGADKYLSNEGARAYVDEPKMAAAGIEHRWQTFTHPTYAQGGPFEPNLSAVDLLFNVGPQAKEFFR